MRSGTEGLEEELRRGFLRARSAVYHGLADRLIRSGRLPEAQLLFQAFRARPHSLQRVDRLLAQKDRRRVISLRGKQFCCQIEGAPLHLRTRMRGLNGKRLDDQIHGSRAVARSMQARRLAEQCDGEVGMRFRERTPNHVGCLREIFRTAGIVASDGLESAAFAQTPGEIEMPPAERGPEQTLPFGDSARDLLFGAVDITLENQYCRIPVPCGRDVEVTVRVSLSRGAGFRRGS